MLVEDIKKGSNNSLEEIQENSAKEVEALKEETKHPLKCYRKTQPNRWRIWTNHPRPKKGSRNNKEKPKWDSSGDRKPRKEIMNHRWEHKQQNTRDRRENLRCRRFHREHGHNNQRKCKMQKDPNSKHLRNPGHNEKTKPTDNSRWEWKLSI